METNTDMGMEMGSGPGSPTATPERSQLFKELYGGENYN